jgi:thiamine biosynthesis lipoprotein
LKLAKRCRPLLGTFVEIECDRPAATEAGFAVIEAIHRLMSAHEPLSELSLVNRSAHHGWVELSEPTAAVLARARHWAKASAGRFDIVRAGTKALGRAILPLHPRQPWPDAQADWTDVALQGNAVRLQRPACLDLGGIAKGFAVDRAVEAMIAAGATRGLVNAGGDLRGFGAEPWRIEVVEPAMRRALAAIDLRDMALTTSAGLPSEDGSLDFGHLLKASRQWVSVTVQAANCCDADALTKIVWTGWPGASQLLRESDAQALAMRADGSLQKIGEETFA